jgi:hypothetical protein
MSKFDKAIERVRGPQTLEQRRERSKSRSGVRSQGWSIFPQERPMEGTPILVRTKDGGEVEGTAFETERFNDDKQYTGIAIRVGDEVYDSNHELWWKSVK